MAVIYLANILQQYLHVDASINIIIDVSKSPVSNKDI
jgi:hypothetical protein